MINLFKFNGISAIAATLLLLSTDYSAYAKGPELAGAMAVFQLAPSTPTRPSPSDQVSWQDDTGKIINLANFKGKVILVNYWASWCAPCLRELPSIDRLQARLGGENFAVVAINIDRGGKSVAQRMVRRLNLKHLTLYLDKESKSARKLGVRSMPTTFVFDRKGREVGKLEGSAEWDDKAAIALLKYFINTPAYADNLPIKK